MKLFSLKLLSFSTAVLLCASSSYPTLVQAQTDAGGGTTIELPPRQPDNPVPPTNPREPGTPRTPSDGQGLTVPPTASDSTQIPRGVALPTTKPMQIVTQVSIPCQTSMQAIDNWVALPQNKCGANNTNALCFVQLQATQGNASTNNILSCPSYYQALFSYGTAIADANNPGKTLVYTPADTQTLLTLGKYNFYNLTSMTGYTCGNDPDATPIVVRNQATGPSGTNPPRPNPSYSNGQLTTFNGVVVRVFGVSRSDSCYTQGPVPAPDSTCTNGVVAGAYWVTDFSYTGQPQRCTRPAGFYPPVSAANNPNNYYLPQPTAGYAPTILMCGKVTTLWKSVDPTHPTEPNACINLP